VLDSLQLTAKHKVATPVNWRQDEEVIIASSVTDDEARLAYPEAWKAPRALHADRAPSTMTASYPQPGPAGNNPARPRPRDSADASHQPIVQPSNGIPELALWGRGEVSQGALAAVRACRGWILGAQVYAVRMSGHAVAAVAGLGLGG
jgi:hypothetical protein